MTRGIWRTEAHDVSRCGLAACLCGGDESCPYRILHCWREPPVGERGAGTSACWGIGKTPLPSEFETRSYAMRQRVCRGAKPLCRGFGGVPQLSLIFPRDWGTKGVEYQPEHGPRRHELQKQGLHAIHLGALAYGRKKAVRNRFYRCASMGGE